MTKLSTSKWTKYKLLKKSAQLQTYLPETACLKEAAFWRMIKSYQEVIIKPTGSYGGKGVICIKEIAPSAYELHDGAKKKNFQNPKELYSYIKKLTGKNFLVQERIPLATVKGRPFDLRVMVQRRPNSSWHVTGKLAKVAGAGFIVTNIRRSSGKVVSVDEAIKQSNMNNVPLNKILTQLDTVALRTAAQLHRYYPSIRTMGIDMGIDSRGHVKIIEVNFIPMLSLFLKLKDKSIFRLIRSFHKK
ncbi:YheC/YheD family protein [Paenibacillus sp. N3.4]|uniref:YheC/YheD family protein n=1 Tax=Paenibacillus sp. N3.4 TaxID=2603222 RepID=UPI0011C92DA1|nr:YheC/YheD family protein [Paenibacillus sp. N3.4]TXK81857.1 hypothetical protein FU659_15870 [Paenibacillus sp. N3.4]